MVETWKRLIINSCGWNVPVTLADDLPISTFHCAPVAFFCARISEKNISDFWKCDSWKCAPTYGRKVTCMYILVNSYKFRSKLQAMPWQFDQSTAWHSSHTCISVPDLWCVHIFFRVFWFLRFSEIDFCFYNRLYQILTCWDIPRKEASQEMPRYTHVSWC
jgi:hypothetical protein